MDEDGYPDDKELETITKWKGDDLSGLMAFIKPLWKYSDCGYWEEEKNLYYLHTGGWSGNEDIIGAMKKNYIWWAFFWCQAERGGHYIFATGRDYMLLEK